jgi:flagellar hook-length control protein FliK
MLNLNLEVDLKSNQTEKARFVSDKDQANKYAFSSELERAEQAAKNNTKNDELKSSQKQSPEQQIGGNLHKPNGYSLSSKLDPKASKNTDENQDISAHAKATHFQTDTYSLEGDIQQQINSLPNQLESSAQTDKQHLEQGGLVKTQPEQQIGGNLHEPQEGDSNSKTINSKLDDVLKLDDSSIPKKPPGALDTPLKLDASQLPTQPVNNNNTDPNSKTRVNNDLLAQIQASSFQNTEVKQHLAPLPKALKDVLSRFQTDDNKVPPHVDKKVDEISPPGLDGTDIMSADIKESKQTEKLGLTPLVQNKQVTEEVSAKLDGLNTQRSQKPISEQLKTLLKQEKSGNAGIKAPIKQIGPDDIKAEEGIQKRFDQSSEIIADGLKKNEKVSSNFHQTRNVEQQIKALPAEQKSVLQQSLQQAVDDGSLNEIQQKRAEEALNMLKKSEGNHTDNKKLGDKAANLMTNSPTQTNPSIAMPSYNSTKVTAQSLSETAQATVEQAKLETSNVVDKVDVVPLIKEQQDGTTRKAVLSPQAENIFKSITALPQQSNTQFTHEQDIMQSAQQFDTALQTAQTQQSISSTQRMGGEQMQGQVLNLQKNDAVKALHEKVNAMLNINNKEAEIRLDPPELGSMQVRIRSEAEQAQVNFVVQNQQAKEALEQSMPKLKEMLAEQGIELGESNIQQDSGSSSEQSTDEAQELANSKLDNPESQAQNSQQTRTNSSSRDSGIDYYA